MCFQLDIVKEIIFNKKQFEDYYNEENEKS